MKKNTLLAIITLILNTNLFCQQFVSTYDLQKNEYFQAATYNNELIRAVGVQAEDSLDKDMLICTFELNGTLINCKTIGTNERDGANAIIPLGDQYLITGATTDGNSGNYADDWVILALDSEGNIEIEKYLGNLSTDDQLEGVTLTSNNRIVAVGVTIESGGNRVATIAALDTSGGLLWSQKMDIGSSREVFENVIETNDGLLVVGSSNMNESSGQSVLLAKFDFTGNLLWSKIYDEGNISGGDKYIELLGNGEAIITDNITNGDDEDILLIKVNSTGGVIWAKKYGGISSDRCNFIKMGNDGNLLIGGNSNSFGQGQDDGLLFKITTDGDLIWAHSYGGSGIDHFNNILEVNNNDKAIYYLFGSTEGSYEDNNSQDACILTVDESGYIANNCPGFTPNVPIVVEDRANQLDVTNAGSTGNWEEIVIHDLSVSDVTPTAENYWCIVPTKDKELESHWKMSISPNPSDDFIFVKILGDSVSEGKIKLMNLQGQIVKEVHVSPSMNNLELSVSQLPVGLYVLAYQADNTIETHKIIVNR